ncbi:MAG: GatB/YqeY domain-containing protein [Chloroflexota bacterium]|nr:GatB/YqeY domain-containing protein [Chloroflexota bacterium]
MDTKEKLTQALKDALRSKDVLRKRVVRMALAAIKNAEVEKQDQLDEPDVLAIIQKEVKMRHETIEGAKMANRADLIAEAEAEIAFLEEFLPKPLTPAELEAIVREVIAEVGAASPRDMGKVMKPLMPKIRGRADGKEASQLVQQILGVVHG